MPLSLLTQPAPDTAPPPVLILYGRDERGRPHASQFLGEQIEEADNVAWLMVLHLAFADTVTLRSLAERLPAGRLFPSGKGLVPFAKGDLYDRLIAATGGPLPAGAGPGGNDSSDAPGGLPDALTDWASIGIGSTVLACQGPMEGWWEADLLTPKLMTVRCALARLP